MLPKPKNSLAIRKMEPGDIPAVSELAARIWRAHYPGIISAAQIEYMLERMYSPEALMRDLKNGIHIWLAEADGHLAGYASVEKTSQTICFLHKLYVDPSYQRRGIASTLMRRIDTALAPKELSLHVNRANIQAINFYIREGFTIDRVQVTDIGNGFVMDDFVMKRAV